MPEVPAKKKHPLKGKGGYVMVAVMALLGALLFIDFKVAPPPREPDANPPVSDFAHLTSADVTRVELKKADGGFTLAKQGGKWGIIAPAQFRANTETVDAWLKGLLEATVSRNVESKPGDLKPYGLDKPAVELVLTAKNGQTRTLQVGKDFRPEGGTAPGSIYYAREARDGRLFMLDSAQVNEMRNKLAADLRDKRLLEIAEADDVRKVVLQRSSGTVEVQRKGKDEWQLLQPFQAEADDSDVEMSLIGSVRSAEAESFAEDAAADLAKYGLDKPSLTLTVTDNKGAHELRFGKTTADGKVFAARAGENAVMVVAKATFDGLNKAPADLRSKDLITLQGDKISSVELKNAHGLVRLQKVGGSEWQIANAPDPKQKKAKGDAVQRVIDSVRAPAFKHVEEAPKDLAKYGLDNPEITVTVNEGRGTSQVFRLGKKTKDGNYYVQGVPNAVFEVQPFVYTDLNVKPDAFKDTAAK